MLGFNANECCGFDAAQRLTCETLGACCDYLLKPRASARERAATRRLLLETSMRLAIVMEAAGFVTRAIHSKLASDAAASDLSRVRGCARRPLSVHSESER